MDLKHKDMSVIEYTNNFDYSLRNAYLLVVTLEARVTRSVMGFDHNISICLVAHEDENTERVLHLTPKWEQKGVEFKTLRKAQTIETNMKGEFTNSNINTFVLRGQQQKYFRG